LAAGVFGFTEGRCGFTDGLVAGLEAGLETFAEGLDFDSTLLFCA
jgi:hypothetical protein